MTDIVRKINKKRRREEAKINEYLSFASFQVISTVILKVLFSCFTERFFFLLSCFTIFTISGMIPKILEILLDCNFAWLV